MIRTLLIANRGEIACRIIRTARRMGIVTVAVYSDADRDVLHVRLADAAIRIGGPLPSQSYLDQSAILDAASASGADAIHPGYGFLSENADFARACAQSGIVFVGPPVDAIHAMGDKSRARKLMAAAGVPVVPGYDGADQSAAAFAKASEAIGYPLLVKAAAGGGGRGMRRVDDATGLGPALESAGREAQNAFGDGSLLLERLVVDARHIEFQVFADRHGNTIHLGERDCSAQRRHQKIIEEAPSPFMTPELRARMGADAVHAAKAVRYEGAGTVEFIVGGDGSYHFLEMNTRLQVEHPVTEMITGLDLVEWQLRIASGEPLPVKQAEVALDGHSIEARLYAEDPHDGFRPQTGTVRYWRPGNTSARIDTGIAEGGEVTPNYDPMIAKIIVHGPDRPTAIARLEAALVEHPLFGVVTNSTFLSRLAGSVEFVAGGVTTGMIDGWIERSHQALDRPTPEALHFGLAGCAVVLSAGGGWFRSSGTGLCPVTLVCGGVRSEVAIEMTRGAISGVTVDGETLAVDQVALAGNRLTWVAGGRRGTAVVLVEGRSIHLAAGAETFVLAEPDPLARKVGIADPSRILAPVSGLVRSVSVSPGDRVERGQTVAMIEAMKMENALVAQAAGIVASVRMKAGDQARAGDVLAELELTADQPQ
ncbi:MAG: biotin carboxylase N-terminal domain-containing protein [Mesorhizobium sp.]